MIGRPAEARLGGYFDAATVAEVAAATGDTLVLLLPGSGVPLAATDRLRVVGRYPGHVTRALLD